MKQEIIILLSLAIVFVVALVCCRDWFSCFGHHESLRNAMGRQLEDARVYEGFAGDVVAESDTVHALKAFETYIMPTLDDRRRSRICSIRHRIEEGKAWVYIVTSGDWRMCYLLDLFPSSADEGYGFRYLVSRNNVRTGDFDPPCENNGVLMLLPNESEYFVQRPISAYEDYLLRLPRFKDALPRIGDAYPYADDNLIDVSAIVDVVDVQLSSVTDIDYGRRHKYCNSGCSAVYQIRLDVREVEKGFLQSDVYILESRRTWDDFKQSHDWVYYRGVTLRVGLHRDGNDLLLIKEQLVEPYPPYLNENVSVSGGALIGGVRADDREGNLEPLVISYGTHTKVEFKNGDIITLGERMTFPDFGVTSGFKILEMKECANKEYWDNAWFLRRSGAYE